MATGKEGQPQSYAAGQPDCEALAKAARTDWSALEARWNGALTREQAPNPLVYPNVLDFFTEDEQRVMRDALAVYEQGTLGLDKSIAAQLLELFAVSAQMTS